MPKRNFLQKAINYLKTGTWLQSDHIESKWLRWLINEAKVIIIAVNNYSRHQIAVRSAALTFYTLMSLVPIVAMIFGIAKGFGIDNKVISYIGQELNAYKELFDQISIFANAFLENSKVGIFAGVSVFVFIWAVIMVFGNIESAFNYIWEIKKQRTISRKVSDYLSVLFVIPLLYVLYKSVSSHIEGTLFVWAADLTFMTNILNILLSITPLIIIWLIFALIYTILPNTHVRRGAALRAAIITGTIYIIFQYLYILFQQTVSNYNIIYGSFAALPLFMIWLNASWQIILFGAELSFAYQNIKKYEYERATTEISYNYRRKLMILIMHYIIKNFIEEKEPMSSEQLAEKLNLPVSAVRETVYELEKAGLVLSIEKKQTKTYLYTPAKDVNKITVWSVIQAVDSHGKDYLGGEIRSSKCVDKLMDHFNKIAYESNGNILLKDLDSETCAKREKIS